MAPSNSIDVGSGKPVFVMVHGICCAPSDYQWHIDSLSRAHRVIAPSLRGHGKDTSKPETLSIRHLADDVAQLLTDKEVNNTILCGHSLGVRVVLEVQRQIPERVAGMVFLDGSNSVSTNLNSALHEFDAATADGKIKPWIQGLFKQMLLPGKFLDEQNNFQYRIAEMPNENLSSLYRNLILWDGQEFHASLKACAKKPVLVIQSTIRETVGSRRSLAPSEVGDFPNQIADNHPNTTVITYHGCSHFLNLDEPQRLHNDILSWAKDHDLL